MAKRASARDIRRDVSGILRAPRRMPVADAVSNYMRVPMGAGNSVPWDPDLAPYVIEPMNCLASREYDAVVFVGPARTGKTIGLIDGWIVYNIVCDPADMLVIQVSEEKAREHSKKRLDRTFRCSPEVKTRLSPRRNDNNVYDRTFRAGNYLKLGWPSVNIMSSSDYKSVALTDYDRFPEDIDGEGDAFSLASKRTTTFMSSGMTLVESSPGRDDRFAVTQYAGATVTLPFVIQNGQTIIRETLIGDGTIGNLKLGNYIQSTTWDGTGNAGWHINKSGYAVFNNVTVRGTVYATNGEFTGKVTATSGSFRGTVEAENFVGDVVNAGVGLDKSKSGSGGVTTNLTYTDTTGTSKPKTVIVSAVVLIYGVSGDDATARISVTIDGTTKDYQWVTCSTRNTTNAVAVPVIFAKSGITKQVVTASISVNDMSGGTNASKKEILSPVLQIARGSGSFSSS